MTERSDSLAPPTLAGDGVTVVRRVGGVTDDGIAFDGFEKFTPGDPGYDELLAQALENRLSEQDEDDDDDEEDDPIDPEALARVLRDAGLDVSDFGQDPATRPIDSEGPR